MEKSQKITSAEEKLLISGPCSAETETQIMAIANGIKSFGVDYFRAGVWKPRTRPNSFEGMGEEAFPWLSRVQKEIGLKTMVEVANKEHVEIALKHGVDAVWIGARTSTSPFAVQEIADALKGVDIPVYVKNPICPDLQLWIGAIERIEQSIKGEVAAIHRGFTPYQISKYRNLPLWDIVKELKNERPDIKIITDPSHMAGNRSFIEELSIKALDFDSDGLMIECHNNPNEAWSDAKQQLTPEDLHKLLSRIHGKMNRNELDDLREEINEIDENIIDLISQRMKISLDIGSHKIRERLDIVQESRLEELLKTRELSAQKKGLQAVFIQHIYKLIHDESVKQQEEINIR